MTIADTMLNLAAELTEVIEPGFRHGDVSDFSRWTNRMRGTVKTSVGVMRSIAADYAILEARIRALESRLAEKDVVILELVRNRQIPGDKTNG